MFKGIRGSWEEMKGALGFVPIKSNIGNFEYETGTLKDGIDNEGGAEGLFSLEELNEFISQSNKLRGSIPGYDPDNATAVVARKRAHLLDQDIPCAMELASSMMKQSPGTVHVTSSEPQ